MSSPPAPREVTGFDPTRKGWYHGGDLKGMVSELDYIKRLGTTAIWLTPSFKNKPVQGLETLFPSAAYHGYWITDFTQIDPHRGTNPDLRDLIAGAHRRGMKVFFDIITNHTADVIQYEQKAGGPEPYDYVSKSAVPYRDANGNVFDDRTYAGTSSFPPLDANVSFPFRPVNPAGEEHDFGAVFEIPLADPAASLNYIIHQPSGDSVPATREPGGDRSFVPAVSPEVWIVSGDPTIHTSRP